MEGKMADETNRPPNASNTCKSCHGKVDPGDRYCRHCGARLDQRTPLDADILTRLVSVEKLLLKTAIGVGLTLLLIGWVVLQTYHFGRGGFR
jgi:hypothetical protein